MPRIHEGHRCQVTLSAMDCVSMWSASQRVLGCVVRRVIGDAVGTGSVCVWIFICYALEATIFWVMSTTHAWTQPSRGKQMLLPLPTVFGGLRHFKSCPLLA
jgi:hypothetical protein